jgi:hypothetical protein
MVSRGEELRQQAQRKKAAALGLLLLCTAFVWSRTLFANDDSATPAVASVAPATTPFVEPTIHPSVAGNASKVASYETALQRLEVWPKALNRKVFHGITENELTDYMVVDISQFKLDLSTTALFGETAVAIINGEKYLIGDHLVLQFEGKSIRYEVSAIHSRRVVLHLGDNEYELKIANFKNASKSLNTNTDRLPVQRDAD